MKKILIWSLLFLSYTVMAQESTSNLVSVLPSLNNTFLKNPYKGWIITESIASWDGSPNVPQKIIDKASIVYKRYHWEQIHKGDNNFDWSDIDARIAYAASQGLKWSFGIVPIRITKGATPIDLPDWVVAAGCQYYLSDSDGVSKVPVWDDPVYIEKMTQLIDAMGARYDNNPNVIHIDNRFYGNWGEWNLAQIGGTPPSDKVLIGFVDIYNNAFSNIEIIQPIDSDVASDYARDTYNNGSRCDSPMNPGYSDKLKDASDTSIRTAEVSALWPDMKSGKTWFKEPWTDQKFINSMNGNKFSYFPMGSWNGNDAKLFFEDNEHLIDEWQNKMGYWFKMTNASFPSDLGNGTDGVINFSMRNDGIARQCVVNFTGCVKIALMDDNYNVLQIVQLNNVNPINWAPSELKVESASFSFPYSPDGTKLALGVFTKSTLVNPDTKLGIDNGTKDNWYVLTDMNREHAAINANAGSDVSICDGENTTLTASGGSSYEWSTGATTASITVSPNTTQTYTVTARDGSGNSDTDDVIITVNSVTANAGADVTIIEGDSVILTANGGGSYEWNTGATTQNITVSPTSSRDYTVTVSLNGCDDTDTVRVNVNATTGSVIANAGSDVSICDGESTILTASGGSTYVWSTGATTASISVSPSTTQTYTVTASDSNGNSDSDDVIVTVNEVTANAGLDRSITEGETITLVATGGDSYLWNTGEKTNSINVSPSATRLFSVTVYKGSCQDIDDVKILVEPTIDTGPLPAQADAGEDMTICLGETIVLNGSGGETYLWSNGETSSSVSVSPSRTATYELTATRGGVTNMDSVTITVENCESEAISDEEDLVILEMAVYPNPTKGKLTIRINNLDQDANFIINDTKGSLIYSDFISGENTQFEKQINLSRYSDGLYFVRLYSAEQYLVKKVMVQ